MNLIIVESPSKAKTIAKYLKGKYKVDASGGHVRDLPVKRLGVKIDGDFEPQYTITPEKKDVIKRLLEEAKKADKVYLATDPDREGEAISWHLQHALKLPAGKNRIEFNEISQNAINLALKNPREINMGLVDAQQARRILDRLVGYKLSPLLNKRIHHGLSAGRVQSVALRLIVEREREIAAFTPIEYWNLTANLLGKDTKSPFKSLLVEKGGKKFKPSTAEEAQATEKNLKDAQFYIKKIKRSVSKSTPPPPFTTSTLQQDGSNKLSISAPEVMRLAQQLYEGVEIKGEGHIALVTYIRTDSVRISADAQSAAKAFILEKYGDKFAPKKPNFYKSKKGAQDAHEAIRPIDLNRTPESVKPLLSSKHFRLYKLIYERFLASQMTSALYDSLQIDVGAGEYVLKSSGRVLKFKGFTQVYEDFRKENDEDSAKGSLLPNLNEGEKLSLLSLEKEQKFTKAPPRYTDASLVKTMEDNGIGRPSTYASVISVLSKRNYTVKEKRFMVPTEIAFKITDLLLEHFSDIINVSFTSKMEDRLDKIEEGGDWKDILRKFYPPFSKKLIEATNAGDELTDIVCEKCGGFMIRRPGRYGKYLICQNSPNCDNVKSDIGEISNELCPKCGANLLIKDGRYGKYLACPNYPDCKYLRPLNSKPGDKPCEKCGGVTVIKTGKFGEYINCLDCKVNIPIVKESDFAGTCPVCKSPTKKTYTKRGKLFYGCTQYPKCDFMSWDEPTGENCPVCNKHMVLKNNKAVCSDKNCTNNK